MQRMIVKGMAMTLFIAALSSPARAGIKEGDINIGVNPSSNQLTLVFDGSVAELPPINGPLFGYGVDDPGFISIENAIMGLVPPGPGSDLLVEVVFFDPALKAWTPGFGSVLHNPGDLWDLGEATVHQHPFWHIDSHDPAFVPPPLQTEWDATVRILDAGSTAYRASDPLTITFTPEPAGLGLLVMVGSVLGWRVRRGR